MPPFPPSASVVADIGGTNVRLARVTRGRDDAPILHDERRLAGDDYADFETCLAAYLGDAKPAEAALAAAGVQRDGVIRLTNRDWTIGIEALKQRFGFERVTLLNDFAAIARALPLLQPADWRSLPGPGWPTALPERVSVIGPGTGLGVAMLLGGADVVPTESGHSAFAPQDAEDAELLRVLLRTQDRVTREELLSGRGLETLHQALAAVEGRPSEALSAARIVEAADQDGPARRTVERFAMLLASTLGDLALIQSTRAVALAGGIPLRIAAFLDTPAFRARFDASATPKADPDGIPIAMVIRPEPGLLGAAALATAEASRRS